MGLTEVIVNIGFLLFRFFHADIVRGVVGVVCLCFSACLLKADDAQWQIVEPALQGPPGTVERICPLTKREHPWGVFVPGTWVVRRTNSQTYSPDAATAGTASVTDTYLTLEEVNDYGLSLRQETIMELADQAVAPTPIRMVVDFYQQPVSNDVTIEQLQPQIVVVARRQVVCQVCRYTQVSADQKKTTTLWYSNTVMPWIFRSEEIRTDLPKSKDQPETVLSHTIMTVTDTSGVRLFKNMLNEYKTQTIKKTATGTTISQATCSANIPGGVLRETTVVTDPNGRITARNVTSVTDYFVASSGTSARRYRSPGDASKEIQTNWDSIPRIGE